MLIILPQCFCSNRHPPCARHREGTHCELASDGDERLPYLNSLGPCPAPNGTLGGPRGAPKPDIAGFVETSPQPRVARSPRYNRRGPLDRTGIATVHEPKFAGRENGRVKRVGSSLWRCRPA